MIIGAGLLLSKRSIAWAYDTGSYGYNTINAVLPISVANPLAGKLIVIMALSGSASIPTPSGYSVAYKNTTFSPFTAIFYKISNGAESDVTLTISGDCLAGYMVYSGIADSPLDATSHVFPSSSATTWTASTLTTSVANDLILSFAMYGPNGLTPSWSSGAPAGSDPASRSIINPSAGDGGWRVQESRQAVAGVHCCAFATLTSALNTEGEYVIVAFKQKYP